MSKTKSNKTRNVKLFIFYSVEVALNAILYYLRNVTLQIIFEYMYLEK